MCCDFSLILRTILLKAAVCFTCKAHARWLIETRNAILKLRILYLHSICLSIVWKMTFWSVVKFVYNQNWSYGLADLCESQCDVNIWLFESNIEQCKSNKDRIFSKCYKSTKLLFQLQISYNYLNKRTLFSKTRLSLRNPVHESGATSKVNDSTCRTNNIVW